MLKYLLTIHCPRGCSYCITKNIHKKECMDLSEVRRILEYKSRVEGHTQIMISGGEPTVAKLFSEKVKLVRSIFPEVYLTTQNVDIFKMSELKLFNAITFSLHDINNRPKYFNSPVPIYGSIIDRQFHQDLADQLRNEGYSGLTINEEQREGEIFDETNVPEYKNFSVKINRRGHCMDEIIILPDLTVINNFRPYLGKEKR